ncbi:MAG: hypothetical protein IAE79_22335, partial [Anaerolinea sp.]|nr:hypothetical protein [Anaerolinea sp.]
RYQDFLHSCIPDEQTAYIKLQRHLNGQRKAFLPLMQVLDLLHRYNISPPHEVVGRVVRFLANSWTQKGSGLFALSSPVNLLIALDLALVQYVLPWIVTTKWVKSALNRELMQLLNGRFPQAATFLQTL